MRIMIRQLAPGMVQQMQSVCTDCNGEGKWHSDLKCDQVVLCNFVARPSHIPHLVFSNPLQVKLLVRKTAVKNVRARKS